MKESIANYFKIMSFALKEKKILEFLNLKWQKDTDIWRQKKKSEYTKFAITPDYFAKQLQISSWTKIDLTNLENTLQSFIDFYKLKPSQTVENPYPVEFGLPKSTCRLLYCLCKTFKPELIIETGVANGFSSSYILTALQENKFGKLISIDNIVRPWHTRDKIGLAIPDNLKNKHQLIVGDSKIELKKLFSNICEIDIAIHDSSHTYENMMNEFDLFWPKIKRNGFLLSDDVGENDAFLDFANQVNHTPSIIKKPDNTYFGIIQKK